MEYREIYVLGQDLPILIPERQLPSPAETCRLVGHLLRQTDSSYRCSHCGYETDRAGMLENIKRIELLRTLTPSPTKESPHAASEAPADQDQGPAVPADAAAPADPAGG